MPAIVSIHDVMPETLSRVESILDWLRAREVPPVTLLVVPGRSWEFGQVERLRQLAAAGHPLAAHGWRHQTRVHRLYHRLHAALISRHVAEHLDLNSARILELLHRSRDWFDKNDLPSPALYVPPAWALGSICRSDLAQAPFQMIETMRGLIHLEADACGEICGNKARTQFQKMPLTGYEADTALRAGFLRRWNAAQAALAIRRQEPLRISIHPDDLQLRLIDQLDAQIRAADGFWDYGASGTA